MGSGARWLCLIVATGCGRVAFDVRTDASTVDGACTEWGPFSIPVKMPEPPNTSTLSDWHPVLTADGLSLYLHQVNFTIQADIVKATRTAIDQPFGAAAVVPELNSPQRDADPTLTADELVIVFATGRSGGPGTQDLMIASRTDRSLPFDPPVFMTDVNSAADELSPKLTTDGLELFYTLNTGPGVVMHAVRNDVGQPFQPPSLVSEVSVAGFREIDVAISPDALELYLASNRPGSLGKYDVWVARRPSRGAAFGQAVHVPELSTATGDDMVDSFSADGTTVYLNYDSDLGGASDMYTATRACR